MTETHQPHPREIRVFLSSTFQDMDAERSHLIKQVFPKVRAACLARQVGFTEIDLRWGVTEEESKNGATVEICLAEIDRCRDFPPFFIGFLGERYGWIPKSDDLAAYWQRHADSGYAEPIREAVKRGISVTELEMELAVLKKGAADKLQGHALFLLRDHNLTATLWPDTTDPRYYDPANGRLETLKERIRQTAFLGQDSYASIEHFGQAIEDYLLAQLDQHFPESAIPSPQERQNQAQTAFRYHRRQTYLPRPDVVDAVRDALRRHQGTPALGPILLTGPSGQGKSALMADMATRLEGADGDTHWQIIDHYIGADERNSLDAWVERLFHLLLPDVREVLGDSAAIPSSTKERREELKTWFAYAARVQEHRRGQSVRFILLLDALDQLTDGGKDLDWLKPEILGADALLIASAADDTPARQSAQAWNTICVPPLTDALKERLIQVTLKRFRKTLPTDLSTRLAAAPQCGSPLFLGLALEELRVDARHESLEQGVTDILNSSDAAHLFLHRFLLDADYSRPEQPDLAVRFMALLGAARNGLTEDELSDLLALPSDPIAPDTNKPRLPQVALSRLITTFQPFLLDKQGNRAPMHRIFGEAALRYLGEVGIREELYAYFRPGYGQGNAEAFEVRGAAEALYQIKHIAKADADQKQRLEDDLAFLPTPARLHDKTEAVVIAALGEFSFEEKSTLAGRWGAQVVSLAEVDIEGFGYSINNFANFLRKSIGHYPSSQALQQPLLDAFRSKLGNGHPNTLMAMGNLANTLSDQGDLSAARTMQTSVLDGFRRILGDEHPYTLMAINDLAATVYNQGIKEIRSDVNVCDTSYMVEAKLMQKPLLEAYRRVCGAEHPDTLRAMNNLASTLNALGELAASRELQEEVLQVSARTLGAEHIDTLIREGNLAFTLCAQGDLAGARTRQQTVLDNLRRDIGVDHSITQWAIKNLKITMELLSEMPNKTTTIRHSKNSPTTTEGETPMRLTNTLKQWLTEKEWEEEPEFNEEKQTSSTGFGYGVEDFSLKCWFDISEKADTFKFYAYYLDTKFPEKAASEIDKFVLEVNRRLRLGQLQTVPDERSIRYYNAIDVENAAFEPAHITNMLAAGGNAMEAYLPKYMAICFGGKTAEEALAEE